MGFSFSEKQKEILKYNNTYRPIITILEGAVRSGKSFLNNLFWIEHVHSFKDKGLNFIMTGHTIPSLKRNVLDDLSSILKANIILNKNNEFKMFGNTICCFGTDKVDSYKTLKGFTGHGWYGNEVSESHKNSIDQAFKRCSGDGARIFWDTNPSGPEHYIKTNYIDKDGSVLKDGQLHIKSWHFTLDDNPFLSQHYVESLKKTTPTGIWYDRDIKGLWVAAEGMIYEDFDLYKHIIDVLPEFKEYFCGVDWGYNHPGVIGLYGTDGDGNSVRIKEITKQGKTLDWWANQAKEINSEFGDLVYYCDPSRPDNIEYFRDNNINAVEADNSVIEGITYVAERFKRGIHYIYKPWNQEYLKKIYNYCWKENTKKEEPIKEDDDCFVGDVKIYTIRGHIKLKNLRKTDLVLTRDGYKPIVKLYKKEKTVREYDFGIIKMICTEDHPFYRVEQDDFKSVKELTNKDMLYSINPKYWRIVCQNQKLLFLKGLNLEDGLNQNICTLESISPVIAVILNRVLGRYIEKSGKTNMGKFQKTIKYIIKTGIRLIIRYKIWSVCLSLNIYQDIVLNGTTRIKKELKLILIKLGVNLLLGINQKREENGIQRIVKGFLKKWISSMLNVSFVEIYLKQKKIKDFVPSSVLTIVNQHIGVGKEKIILKSNVIGVDKVFIVINIKKFLFVQEAVVKKHTGKRKKEMTYNLTVCNKPEYFANNILVHNCMDSERYALYTHYRKDSEPRVRII